MNEKITQENNPARSTLAAIVEAYNAWHQLESGDAESVEVDFETFVDPDTLRERLEEWPLSVLVRSGWTTPGDDAGERAEEYEILMSTGGPAVRIVGELGRHAEPESAEIQGQGWFQPWTTLHPDPDTEERDALEWFAGLFWFGE